jgi:hypothetical protein
MKTAKEAAVKSETELAVADYLTSIGVAYSVAPAGAGLIRNDNWECDGWSVLFQCPARKAAERFDYYTGLGHRVLPGNGKPMSWANVQNPRELERWCKQNAKPFAPFAASVLYSLILDSSAAHQSFRDWCADYGYNNDSIAHQQTYNECCINAEKLRRVFTREQMEHLQTLLQDY